MSHAHTFTVHTPPSRQGGKMQDTIKELVAKSLMQTEALCAAFLKQNPDLPITDVQLCQKTEGDKITWWMEPRAEDRAFIAINKQLEATLNQYRKYLIALAAVASKHDIVPYSPDYHELEHLFDEAIKSNNQQMSELHEAIKRGEKILLGGKYYRFEECEDE